MVCIEKWWNWFADSWVYGARPDPLFVKNTTGTCWDSAAVPWPRRCRFWRAIFDAQLKKQGTALLTVPWEIAIAAKQQNQEMQKKH